MRRDLSSWLGTLGMTGRKATYRRSRTNHTLKSRGAAHAISLAGGEPLDSRKMLAVTAQAVGDGLLISLDADFDVAGLVLNTGTSKYEVYDDSNLVGEFEASGVQTIQVIDSAAGGGEDQVFEVRDGGSNGGSIAASLGVSNEIETTKVFSDIDVTSKSTITGGYGIVLSSPTIILDDATLGDPLVLFTNNTDVQFDGFTILKNGSQVQIGSGKGAGDIDFQDYLAGEDGSGTLALTAGTGTITWSATGPLPGEDYSALHGVVINSAASVSSAGLMVLDGNSPIAFANGLTIADGVNNVDLSNGGLIFGFGEDAGIRFLGSSTNSTIEQFEIRDNDAGIVFGEDGATSDLSGTVVDDNDIHNNVNDGIDLYSVAGNLNGEDAFIIGGKAGNRIYANGWDGIYGVSSIGVEITNNAIYDNGFLSDGSGINLEEGGEYLITENTIGEDGPGGYLGNAINGITIDGDDGFYSYAGTEITFNTIAFNNEYGVRVQGVTLDTGEDSILIFGNTVVGNFDGGVRIDGSENIRIIDNLIAGNGEDVGNGIDIVNGSHGTLVESNQIIQNANHGVYVENSSTLANPVVIGGVLGVTSSTGTSVNVSGDQRAAIVPGQAVFLAYAPVPDDVSTITATPAEVLSLTYDADADETTLVFASVTGSPAYVTLGNYVVENGEDSLAGSGISVLATGEGTPGEVVGLEILGNVVVGNQIDGIHLESTFPASQADLSDVVIAGNFVGRDIVGEDAPIDFGNGDDGIEVVNGNRIVIVQNYVADNGDPNPSTGEDENGIAILTSRNVDIGEDGLGNYIVRNADDGIDIKGSQFVTIVDNEIAFNGDDGICGSYEGARSSDVLVAANWIHDNASRGIDVDGADRVEIVENLIEDNGLDGILARDGEDVYVGFSIIRGHNGDGVDLSAMTGII